MKNEAHKLREQSKCELRQKPKAGPSTIVTIAGLASSVIHEPGPSRISRILAAISGMFKQPDLTLEQWEQLERKHSPHSSHHAQIYHRERRR